MRGPLVGVTAARRADEQAALVRALGGVPVLGPAVRADAPSPDGEVLPALEAALAAPLDVAVFLTGVGAALLMDLAARAGREAELRAALAAAWVVARGPKPRRELRALGVRADWVVDPPRTPVIRDALLGRPLGGRRVLVQGFGPPPDELVAPLRAAGAVCVVASPYAASWPVDPEPAVALARRVAAGRIDAVTFTSAQAGRQFVALADRAGIPVDALRAGGALVAAVGPVTRVALEDEGLPVDVEPDPPRMGALYHALAGALAGPSPRRRPLTRLQ